MANNTVINPALESSTSNVSGVSAATVVNSEVVEEYNRQNNIEEAIICHVDSKGNETQLEFTKTEEDTVAVSTRMLGTFVIASPALLKEEVTAKNAPLRAPATMTGAADAKYYTDRTGNIGVSSEGFTDATANLSLYAGSLYDSTLIVGGIHAEGCF